MKTLLKIEVAVLLVLVLAAMFVRVGITGGAADTLQSDPSGASQGDIHGATDPKQTDTAQTTVPEETTVPTEPPAPTAPEVVLTFSEDFSLESRDYFVYDCTYDRILAISGEESKKIYPASVTKLFTAYVALQYLQPDQVITLGREVNLVGEGSSLAYVRSGQRISVAHLVEGMLLPSGNDAAYGLAAAAARKASGNSGMEPSEAIAYFVELMNQTAQGLGMTGSHFTNPDGYHDMDHYTCARDLMTIGALALENECIRTYASTYEDKVTYASGEIADWHNTNALVNPQSQYYCEDAIGLKTGHTSYAGFCVLSAFSVDGNDYVIGTFGCVRPEDRFIDAVKLYEVLIAALRE